MPTLSKKPKNAHHWRQSVCVERRTIREYFELKIQKQPFSVDLFIERHKKYDPMLAIPVERISCPILILSGEQDKIWPSSIYAQEIMQRLDEKDSKIESKSLTYPNAGHGIISPYEGPIYHPVGKFWCTLGGTPSGNQDANKNAWQEVLKFLERFK